MPKYSNEFKLQVVKYCIEELIDTIYIHEGGNITIKFKYQDEYFEDIRFIKMNNCDIMEKNVI